jgi:hypothetical protein
LSASGVSQILLEVFLSLFMASFNLLAQVFLDILTSLFSLLFLNLFSDLQLLAAHLPVLAEKSLVSLLTVPLVSLLLNL